jgi:hypothetical protein
MLQKVGAGFKKQAIGIDGPALIVQVPGSGPVGLASQMCHFSELFFKSHAGILVWRRRGQSAVPAVR